MCKWIATTLKAADACLLSVSVYKDGVEKAIIDMENSATLECDGRYSVTLTLPKESASGYLVLTVDGKEYYSDYLQRNDDADGILVDTFTPSSDTILADKLNDYLAIVAE